MAELKISKADLKSSGIFLGAVLALILLYNICTFCFVFIPTFGREELDTSAEHLTKFYGSKENYEQHMQDALWLKDQNCPLIEIQSYDGLKLKALVLEASHQARGIIILLHGYHSSPSRDFATLARFYNSLDYTLVLPYERSHGLSEGKFITFGVKERYDLRDWINKVTELYGADMNIFVHGISMGCATTVMAGGFDYGSNLRGLVADCGFTSPYEILYWNMLNTYHLPRFLARLQMYSNNKFANWFAGFDFNEYSTSQALSHTKIPVLFITGDKDKKVPADMSQANFLLYKTISPNSADLVIIEGAPHAVSYFYDKEKYFTAVEAFLLKYGV